jgi:outer membrane protein TolC
MKSLARVLMALLIAAPLPAGAQERPTLELSLEEAVKRTLENNADLAVEKLTPQASAYSVQSARGVYDPLLSSSLSRTNRDTAATSVLEGGNTVTTETTIWNFQASQLFRTGGSFNLSFTNNKINTTSIFNTFNPSFTSSLNANLSQPLLRNFRIDSSRQQLTVSKRNKEISDIQFRQTVVNTVASVKQQYYDLIAAIDNLDAARKSLALAQKLLDENRIKVRVGTMAPLDVVQAESEVATREEGVIVAENQLAEAEDALKRQIFPGNDPEMWALRIVPTDRPQAEPVAVDVDAAIRSAIEKRTDIEVARRNLQNNDLTFELARNQSLPAVDLVATYGTRGVGGTSITRQGLGGPIVGTVPGGYGDALSDVFARSFPTWTVGVNFSYPILNRSAKATEARAQLAREQAQASLRRLEMQIAAEVRTAARAVQTNMKRVESTRAARVLSAQRLDAEEKKFAAGMTTNFFVTQAQRDLAIAEVNELRAIADYRKSLIAFERVQEAGGGGGGSINVSVGGGGRAQTVSGGGGGSFGQQ